MRSTNQCAVLGVDGNCLGSTGQLDAIADSGHDADLGELLVVARDEHDALVVTHGNGERDAHAGENHHVIQRDQP